MLASIFYFLNGVWVFEAGYKSVNTVASPTNVYTKRAKNPYPKINATTSKLNNHINPRLSHHTIKRIRATFFTIGELVKFFMYILTE